MSRISMGVFARKRDVVLFALNALACLMFLPASIWMFSVISVFGYSVGVGNCTVLVARNDSSMYGNFCHWQPNPEWHVFTVRLLDLSAEGVNMYGVEISSISVWVAWIVVNAIVVQRSRVARRRQSFV